MLARSFLSAEDLGIRQDQRDALIKVLHMLERGELVHTVFSRVHHTIFARETHRGFNMTLWVEKHRCGTIACIGGWAELVANDSNLFDVVVNKLDELFSPPEDEVTNYASVTVEQASRALSSYLTTGDPRWSEATKS